VAAQGAIAPLDTITKSAAAEDATSVAAERSCERYALQEVAAQIVPLVFNTKSTAAFGAETEVLQLPDAVSVARLGANTESPAAFGAETEVLQLPDAVSVARLERYELQSVARKLLTGHRITHCLRTMLPGAAAVPVYYAPASSSSHYGQLMVCGSVWFCPVCASKISERRRRELEQALSWWVAKGHTVLLVTYTFSHGRGDHVGEILDNFLGAQENMTRNRPYRRLRGSCGVIHSIKALEVTWGAESGWHPHSHWLLFCDGNVDVPRMENELYRIWKAEAAKKGLTMNRAHGVKIQNTFGAVADYVAKFGKEHLNDSDEEY